MSDGCIWVRVIGPGTFQNSTRVKDFAKEMTSKGHRDFVLDLEECSEVDSTFMGTCAFIALRLRELGEGTIRIVNASSEVVESYVKLGLDQLIRFETEEQPQVMPR